MPKKADQGFSSSTKKASLKKVTQVQKTVHKKKVERTMSSKMLHYMGKKNNEIATPKALYKALNKEFKFDFDPCPLKRPKWDGLKVDWKKSNYINPPYSEIKKWLEKGVEEFQKGKLCVFLIPLRSHLKYWQKYIYPFVTEVRFLNKIRFEGFDHDCPFPICVLVFDPKKQTVFEEVDVDKKEGIKYFVHQL